MTYIGLHLYTMIGVVCWLSLVLRIMIMRRRDGWSAWDAEVWSYLVLVSGLVGCVWFVVGKILVILLIHALIVKVLITVFGVLGVFVFMWYSASMIVKSDSTKETGLIIVWSITLSTTCLYTVAWKYWLTTP